MNPSPRQLELIEEVRRLQNVTVEALGERFGVTLQTVRRDIRQLTDAGLLTRFHGGVRMPGSTTENIESINVSVRRCGTRPKSSRPVWAAR